jgi:hypothetical protein
MVGHISKPVGQVTRVGGGTADVLFNNGFRGNVVGQVAAQTSVGLANGAATNVQDLSLYDGCHIEGVLYVNGTAYFRATVRIDVSKKASDGTYVCTPSLTTGDTDPGISIGITSAGVLQITLPSVAGFVSANFNYTLGAPQVGATFPLSVSGKQLTAEKNVQVYTAAGALASGPSATQHLFNNASPMTMTVGSAVGIEGTLLFLKNIGAGTVTIDFFGSETCEGNATVSLIQWETVTLMAYNGNWIVVG